jgi:myo-inositol-1(or 4)-monophosphatase
MNLEEICKKTIEVSKLAAKFIQGESANFNSDRIETKGKSDLVSYVDKNAEKIIIEALENIIPEAGFIAEENTSSKKGEHYNWIIDPLDGTTNFIHGLPCYSISIALMLDEKIILGVVHELNKNEIFYAWLNGGAWLDGKPIRVSKINTLENSLLVTGFPYTDNGNLARYMNLMQYFIERTHGVRRLGSAAVDLAYVAAGRLEAFYEYNLKAWDLAAGSLIVQEAGGKVTDFSGGENYIFGKELLASNGGIHEDTRKAIQDIFIYIRQ